MSSMTKCWLAEISVSPVANEFRRNLSVAEYQRVTRIIENIVIVLEYPVKQVTEEVLSSLASEFPLAKDSKLTALLIELANKSCN